MHGQLHVDVVPSTSTVTHLAVERVLADRALAQPDRRGLPEDLGAGPRRRRVGRDQHGQRVRRPALLHQDRGQPGVRGAGVEQGRDHGRPEPRVEVVDVGLEQQRAVGPVVVEPVAGSRRAAAARWRAPPGRGRRRRRRSRSTVIAGCGPYAVASVVEQRGAGRRAQLDASPGPAYDGTPRSSSATAGGGTGSVPCAPCDVPGADRDRGDHERVEAEVLEARRTPRPRRRSRRARRPRGSARRRARCRARPPRRRRAARRSPSAGRARRRRGRRRRAARGRRARCGGWRSRRRRRGTGWRRTRCG